MHAHLKYCGSFSNLENLCANQLCRGILTMFLWANTFFHQKFLENSIPFLVFYISIWLLKNSHSKICRTLYTVVIMHNLVLIVVLDRISNSILWFWISTPVLLTKNLENVCHALKSPHPKYHVIIITRSRKIRFWRSCGWGTPFEITTFICNICSKNKSHVK